MKHRHDRHHNIGVLDAHRLWGQQCHCVTPQHRLRVLDAFRQSRRARGVTQPRRLVVGQRGPVDGCRAVGKERLVVGRRRQADIRHRRAHEHELLNAVEGSVCIGRRGGLGDCFSERRVDKQQPVLSIRDDMLDVMGRQEWVDCVQLCTAVCDPEVRLKVPTRVPTDCSNSVASTNPGSVQGIAELAHTVGVLGVALSGWPVAGPGNDLPVGVELFRAPEERPERLAACHRLTPPRHAVVVVVGFGVGCLALTRPASVPRWSTAKASP